MELSLQQTFFAVFGGLALAAGAASVLVHRLMARTADPVKLTWIGQLNSRLQASWLILLLFAVGFALGEVALAVIFAVASFFALREFVALTPIKPADHIALAIAFYVAIPVQYVLVAIGWYQLYAVFIPVYLFLVLPVIMAWRHDTELYLQRVAKVQWGLMLSVYCVSHAPAIATIEPPGYEGRGALLLLYFLLVVQLSENIAVAASASFGRTPLRSNPNKSREGVLIGGAAATVIGTLLWWMTPFTWWQAALMSAATVLAAFMGGLVLASVKRSLGERQWDQGVALSRGVLERLEGITFSAPVFFHATIYFFVP
ncbi:MAG: phosphatidate cytidylyltransferase [Burkholderiales bacterium]|jgi:phosphatidate cytidylyltransferase|nr:phosphatidate cytidylyltransferase [Burkholderiales bacterium]